jgi:signal transduction histidine kinase
MTSSNLQDVSLYELVLSSNQTPQPLQISPATFKSVIVNFLNSLIDRQIPATILAKLPRGAAWQSELEHYRRLAITPQTIYLLKSFREEEVEKPDIEDMATAKPLQEELTTELTGGMDLDAYPMNSTPLEEAIPSLILPADSPLRREYFLLVLSPEWCGFMLAHRPRGARSMKAESGGLPSDQIPLGQPPLIDDKSERKQFLLGVCSFEPDIIERILQRIYQIAFLRRQPQLGDLTSTDTFLENWASMLELVKTASLNPIAVGSLFVRQIQNQEEVWHTSTSSRKQAETATALQMQNEELLNAIRLKDEFLKNVGQELRTPLSTMKTALTLLNSPNLRPAQRQRYMEMLSQECDRQSSLITSVLDLLQLENSIDQTPFQPLRLVDIVPGVVSTYQPLAQEKGVMLAYTISEDLPAISCVNTWLRQIVINLLHNAIKFTSQGGRVWVRAKQQGDYLQIEFQDTGVGITPTDIPKIFDRFYRARPASSTTSLGEDSSGAGLGLSIVQQLLLRSGGSISVKSKVGEGSTFTILLPIYR